jgi:predicted Zn-dependent protease
VGGQPAGEPSEEELYRIPINALQTSQRLIADDRREEGRHIARRVLETASQNLKAGDDSAMNHFILGMAAGLLDLESLAIDYLQKSVTLNPGYLPAQQALAKALFQSGRTAEAIAGLEKGADRFAGDVGFQRMRADLYALTDRKSEAIAIYEALRVDHPDDERIFHRLLALYQEVGDFKKAEGMLDRLVGKGEMSETERSLSLAAIGFAAGDARQGRSYLQEVRRAEPDHPAIPAGMSRYYDLSADQAMADGQLPRAILFWERALEFLPENDAVRIKLGAAYGESGDYQRSIEMLEPLLEEIPEDPAFYVALARALHGTGRGDVALETLDRVTAVARARKDAEAVSLFEQTRADLVARGEVKALPVP